MFKKKSKINYKISLRQIPNNWTYTTLLNETQCWKDSAFSQIKVFQILDITEEEISRGI